MSDERDTTKAGDSGERDKLKPAGGEPDFQAHKIKEHATDEPKDDETDDFELHKLKPA
jgi:hypothetical protein